MIDLSHFEIMTVAATLWHGESTKLHEAFNGRFEAQGRQRRTFLYSIQLSSHFKVDPCCLQLPKHLTKCSSLQLMPYSCYDHLECLS